jgi:hypothetical protein
MFYMRSLDIPANVDDYQKHSVGKLKSVYEKRTQVKVDFKYNNSLANDATQMGALNHQNDNVIVFTAHECLPSNPVPSPNISSPNLRDTRRPLEPINVQLLAVSAMNNQTPNKHVAKTEVDDSYSPYNSNTSSVASSRSGELAAIKHEPNTSRHIESQSLSIEQRLLVQGTSERLMIRSTSSAENIY